MDVFIFSNWGGGERLSNFSFLRSKKHIYSELLSSPTIQWSAPLSGTPNKWSWWGKGACPMLRHNLVPSVWTIPMDWLTKFWPTIVLTICKILYWLVLELNPNAKTSLGLTVGFKIATFSPVIWIANIKWVTPRKRLIKETNQSITRTNYLGGRENHLRDLKLDKIASSQGTNDINKVHIRFVTISLKDPIKGIQKQ